MSSIGGCRRPARASAHAFQTIGLARLRRRTLCRDDRRHRGAGRARSISRRPGAAVRRARRLLPAHDRGRDACLFEHCARASTRVSARRRTRLAVDRHGRLERRHESGRRDGQRRERLARLVPARDACGVRAVGKSSRSQRAPQSAWRTPLRCEPHSSARVGTAIGTGAAISTTERRSARPPATNAGSTRLRNPGA